MERRAERRVSVFPLPNFCLCESFFGSWLLTRGSPTAIESRVARIKARVAELTGNMQGQEAPTAKL